MKKDFILIKDKEINADDILNDVYANLENKDIKEVEFPELTSLYTLREVLKCALVRIVVISTKLKARLTRKKD